MISSKIVERNWFFGEKSSEIDCTIYAYLAILQHIGLQNNTLKAHINECPNLVKYTNQIRTKYLTGIEVSIEKQTITDSFKQLFISKEDGSLSKTTVKICAGIFAVGAMILFAVTHGLLEVCIQNFIMISCSNNLTM